MAELIITHLMSISPALYSARSILSYFIRMFGNKYLRAGGVIMEEDMIHLILSPVSLSLCPSVSLIVSLSNMSE